MHNLRALDPVTFTYELPPPAGNVDGRSPRVSISTDFPAPDDARFLICQLQSIVIHSDKSLTIDVSAGFPYLDGRSVVDEANTMTVTVTWL